MEPTWIVVAHRSGAQVFRNPIRRRGLVTVAAFHNPDGRRKNHELSQDRPGRTLDPRGGHTRTALEPDTMPTRYVAESFALRIAEFIEKGRKENSFSRLALVAEPRFLGMLWKRLSRTAQRQVYARVEKDLAWMAPKELEDHLRSAGLDYGQGARKEGIISARVATKSRKSKRVPKKGIKGT